MNWILNLLSILVFFINRFWFRKKQTVSFKPLFWLQNNWPEASITLLLNLIFMLLIGTDEATKALENLPPALTWVYFFGKPGLSVAIGFGLSWGIYGMIGSKVKDIKDGKI